MLWWISDSVRLYVLVAGKRGIPIKFVCWECNISTFYHSDTETQDASASHNHPANKYLQNQDCLNSMLVEDRLWLIFNPVSLNQSPFRIFYSEQMHHPMLTKDLKVTSIFHQHAIIIFGFSNFFFIENIENH